MLLVKSESTEVKTIESIMSKHLITIDADSSAFEAAKKMSDIMIKNKVRHLGVTYSSSSSSNHNAQIIGIVSSRDLVRLFIHKLGKNEKVLTNQLINNYYWQEEPVEEINS